MERPKHFLFKFISIKKVLLFRQSGVGVLCDHGRGRRKTDGAVSVVAVASEADHTGNRRQSTSGSGRNPAGKAGRVRSAADGLEAEKTEAVRQGHLFVLASV